MYARPPSKSDKAATFGPGLCFWAASSSFHLRFPPSSRLPDASVPARRLLGAMSTKMLATATQPAANSPKQAKQAGTGMADCANQSGGEQEEVR